eukprot:2440383-Rhodomonas_salina.1
MGQVIISVLEEAGSARTLETYMLRFSVLTSAVAPPVGEEWTTEMEKAWLDLWNSCCEVSFWVLGSGFWVRARSAWLEDAGLWFKGTDENKMSSDGEGWKEDAGWTQR